MRTRRRPLWFGRGERCEDRGMDEAESEAAETTEITGVEEVGRAGTPPNLGNPNCVKACCLSIAERDERPGSPGDGSLPSFAATCW